MNENWPRWFTQSFYKYITSNLTGEVITLEGDGKDPNGNRIEIQVDGPWASKPSNVYCFEMILGAVILREIKAGADIFATDRIIGKLFDLYMDAIPIKDDNDDTFGCFKITESRKGLLLVDRLGVVNDKMPLLRTHVYAKFEVELNG